MSIIGDLALSTARNRKFLECYDKRHPSGGFERSQAAHRFYCSASALREAINRELGGDAAGRKYQQEPAPPFLVPPGH